jgi:hypothetical protein
MLDVLAETSQGERDESFEEEVEAADDEEIQNSRFHKGKRVLMQEPKYYSRQQQLELVMAAQELLRYGEHDGGDVRFSERETYDADAENTDIWEDEVCLKLLMGSVIHDTANLQAGKRVRKRTSKYC